MKERIKWIDTAKGILILLVVLGHCAVGNVTSHWINSFHMAAFFVLSGITFSIKEDFKSFTVKKVKSLLLPYFVFSFIMLLYAFLKSIVLSGRPFDLLSGIVSVFVLISGRNSTTVYGLWFLPCLFLGEELLYMILVLFRKSRSRALGLAVGAGAGCFLIHYATGNVSVVSILPFAVLFLYLGVYIKNHNNFGKKYKIPVLMVSTACFVGAATLNYIFFVSGVDLSSLNLGFWPLYLISSVAGSIMICVLSIMLENISFLSVLGKDSLYYYGLHYEAIGIVERIISISILQMAVIFLILYPLLVVYKKMKKGVHR